METRDLLRYWRHSLADGELTAPNWRKSDDRFEVSRDELITGEIASKIAKEIVERVAKRLEKRKKKSKRPPVGSWDDEIREVDVLVAPFRLRRIFEHGQSRHQDRQSHAPFWIAARLDKNGRLSPSTDRAAWFVRQHLDPSGWNDTIVGSLDAMDSFLGKTPGPEDPEHWSSLVGWAEEFFSAVTGASPWSFQLDGHETIETPFLLPEKTLTGAGVHLLKLYDALAPKKGESAMVETLPRLVEALQHEQDQEPIDASPALDHEIRARHLGHMSGQFPLGAAQRESLHTLRRLERGEILALNGPPGTGKTTWIQGVVASLWVERALAGGDPPILVATSANNRAVTNILDTFEEASKDDAASGGLAERWLPKIDTYGLYFPSSSRAKKGVDHRWAAPGRPWSGLPQLMENEEYLDESRVYYLGRARAHYGASFVGVEAVVAELLDHMVKVRTEIAAHLAVGSRLETTRASMPDPTVEAAFERLGPARNEALSAVERAERLEEEIDGALRDVSLVEEIFSFLPPIRDRRNERFVSLFERHGVAAPDLSGWSYRPELRRALAETRRSVEARRDEIEAEWREIEAWGALEQDWWARIVSLCDQWKNGHAETIKTVADSAKRDPRAIEDLVDPTLRRRLFLLAGRYWEGRWILDLQAILGDDDSQKLYRQSREDCLRRFRRFAMVTPLFVSTVYMLPKIFDHFERGNRPLVEGIDLLIVEEAGQVSPEIGGALFALAERAVVLGDVYQIEPIWSVPKAIDDANRERHGVKELGPRFHSSKGSLMEVAQRVTRYTLPGHTDGLWLREHRRCVPDVIAYCKELVYKEVLEAKRPEIDERILPALGYGQIRSKASRRGGSWRNEGQAQAIAHWLAGRRASLEAFYDRPLDEIVGLVTPYRAQAAALRSSIFGTPGLDELDLDIGTVHTFQGGEMPVMLFSPVMTRDEPENYFFDRGPNMLNVAVSRAKDSFLVFGDMKIFQPKEKSKVPSHVLARHLFANESNELPDVDPAPDWVPSPESPLQVVRLSGLDAHRRTLQEAFDEAQDRLLVVSPYLTPRAIEADQFIEGIARTRARVTIAYSRDMADRDKASAAAERLCRAGAEVVVLHGFHTKTLAVDEKWFVEGSFNWLSAVRDEGARFQHHEASIRCGNPPAGETIPEIWEEIERGRFDPVSPGR